MKIYTAGMLKTFSQCPEKYNLIYNEHLEAPSDDNSAVIGKKIHSLIYFFLKGENVNKMILSLDNPQNENLKTLWKNFLSFGIRNVSECELTFNVILNENILMTGRADALREKKDTIEILDWKTGSSDNINPEREYQTIVYLYCVYKLLFLQHRIYNPENLSMTYYFLKNKTYKTVKFSKEKYKIYEIYLNELTEKIMLYQYNTSNFSDKCVNCSFKIICQNTY